MQAVIMAGGSGVRLRPFTYAIPKPLLPIGIGDLTILEYTIQSLSQTGFNDIFLITSHQHEKFQRCHEYENKYGIEIHICFEGKQRGTAGGIILLRDQLNDNFLVLNGDLLVRTDFDSMSNYHLENKADITIGTTTFGFTIPYGVIEFGQDNELANIIEKPKHSALINAGIYILNSSVFDLIEHTTYLDMPELIALAMKGNKRIRTYHVGDRWLDTGQFDDYERAVERIEKWSKGDS